MTSSDSHNALVSGSLWITASEVIKAISSLTVAIVAARVLDAQDFGLMGIIYIVISILEVSTKTGFERALIQKQKDPTPYLNVAFTWHIGRGVLLGILMLVLAPILAHFYEEPLLGPTVAACGLYLVFQGAKNTGEIFFSRDLDFKVVCAINAARSLLKLAVAIPAIFIFQNVWALVIEFVAGGFLTMVISYVAHSYRPRLEWDWPKAKELIQFGKWIFGLSILGFIMNQGDDLFISTYMGATALGFYYYAFEISNWPATKITHVLSKVSFPTYSRLQDEPRRLREAFLNVMKSSLLLTGPVSVAIFLLVPHLVYYVIGSDWAPIIPVVQVLVIAGLTRSFQALAGALFQACGRPDLDFKMNVPRALALAVLIWPMTAWAGLEGAASVVIVALLVSLPIWFYGVFHLVDVTFWDVLQTNTLSIITSAVLWICLSAMDGLIYFRLPTWYGAIASIAAGLTTWALLMYLIERVSPWKLYAEMARLKSALQRD